MSAQTARPGVVLAAALSCLLVFTGFLAGDDRFGSSETTVPTAAISGDRVVAPRLAPAQSATSGSRITGRQSEGRALSGSGHRLPRGGSSEVVQPDQRISFVDDRVMSGPGEHLAVRPVAFAFKVPASHPMDVEGATGVPAGAPCAASAARAPPAV